ncbi:hypothetical protein TIFTF001_008689 [Ficus carica]|uniref:Uncharacterized protein n=1 Tax=Ficus carica TaxID=3494 RepID=A0AA87ZLV6_FICCA|nr:hypothetical protein TIFTF001_008689 [Ficus carica]
MAGDGQSTNRPLARADFLFAESMVEQRKGNRSTWASRGQQCTSSVDCITVQSLVWTEPLCQTISVLFELKSMSSN